jgi:hypothetical protein
MSKKGRSTLAALLEQKPKRGRPSRAVSRKNVYVALTQDLKQRVLDMARELPTGLGRADIPDMAINLLSIRMELLRRDVADRDREIPEGVTDLDSLYLLWDLSLPAKELHPKWTSIRVSPQPAIELGRIHGVLNAMFGVNRSQVYGLSLTLFGQFLEHELDDQTFETLPEVYAWMQGIYL